ncbi:hypothetical protein C8A03DRAFT_32003 [Achaetomium macrosporum]|uniref:Acetylserotonin methytransferase-like protein n=1 Tax=Achaetomium macrosporum TaxID=79813 RepID=A0AAN7HCM5_9PEZI|nr:hypothetical protein C8A03DRAFT_32003 [Achaetomium macrosporum]
MSAAPVGGFSLFPNPNNAPRPPLRSQSRPRAATPQEGPAYSSEVTPPHAGRHTQARRHSSARETKPRGVSNNPWQHALDARKKQPSAESTAGPSAAAAATVEDPVVETTCSQPVTETPQRCETAFSEAQTLVRSSSQRSRSSIAKPPIAHATAGPSSSSQPGESEEPAPIRSIFPRYNPDVPLDQQEYYPTQASPTHIPQSAISRPMYSPRSAAAAAGASSSGQAGAQIISPGQTTNSNVSWPPAPGQRHHEPAVMPPVSTTEELRGLWKVTNGWKASSLEGRRYCLKMAMSPDAPPAYTLSSSSGQPFYCLRVDPTSASALVTLSRYDPNKPFKAGNTAISSSTIAIPSPNSRTSSPSPRASSSSRQSNYPANLQNTTHTPSTTSPKHQKYWQEVLSTNLSSSPAGAGANNNTNPDNDDDNNDGLLAHLWPTAAARLVADRANDAATVALAQQESARLVWDADSGNHFLVHPALAMPFCVTVERSPAYSRTEYTLEHLESPVHLARLVRDGTGAGWLEVDTGIASKIDAVYLVDVVVAALVLVAHGDGKGRASGGGGGGGGVAEVFEPPPVVFGGPNGSVYSAGVGGGGEGGGRGSRSWSRLSSRREDRERKKSVKKGKKARMEQFEMDLESQSSDLGKGDKDKLPGVLRVLVGLITVTFKCFVWCATVAFKTLVAILSGLAKCCGLGKF